MRADGYGFQVEMTYLTERNGGRITEVPIEFRDRSLGRSKMSSRIVVEAFVLVTWWGVRDRLSERSRASCRAILDGMALAEFTVAGALVESPDGLLLVRNQRRSGATDWSTPGGVIDATDATLRAGLAREVGEETGPARHRVGGPALRGAPPAVEMGWVMRCEVHRALAFEGEVVVDDPDRDRGRGVLRGTRRARRVPGRMRAVGAGAARGLDRAPVGPRRRACLHLRRVRRRRDELQVVRTSQS